MFYVFLWTFKTIVLLMWPYIAKHYLSEQQLKLFNRCHMVVWFNAGVWVKLIKCQLSVWSLKVINPHTNPQKHKDPTFWTVSIATNTFLCLVSSRVGDDNFLAGIGANQCTRNNHIKIVICKQGDKLSNVLSLWEKEWISYDEKGNR